MGQVQVLKPKISQVDGRIRFGENTAALAGHTLWPGASLGQAVKIFNAGPLGLWISSDNALDVGIDIIVEYLEDTTLIEKTTLATLNGFTFVQVLDADSNPVAADFVNRGWVASKDDQLLGNCMISSDNTDAAVADGIPDDTTKIEAIIPPADQQTMQCILKVPANVIGCVEGWNTSLTANAANVNVKAKLMQLPPEGSWRTVDAMPLKNVGRNPDVLWPFCREFVTGTILKIVIISASNAVNVDGNIYMRQDPA